MAGNIRELENLIEFLILNAEDEYITPHMLPANIAGRAAEIPASFILRPSLKMPLDSPAPTGMTVLKIR